MSDWDRLLSEGRAYQYEEGLLPPRRRPPSMVPWVVLAVLLVLTSLGIELFWPLPSHHGPLPVCQPGHMASASSCQKQDEASRSSEKPGHDGAGHNAS